MACKNQQLLQQQDMAHILVKDKLAAVISGPQMNFSYQVHETKWAAAQRRPVVRLKKKILYSDSKSGLHDYNWYKIEGNTAIPVGSGTSFTPIISGKYVVEAIQGFKFIENLSCFKCIYIYCTEEEIG